MCPAGAGSARSSTMASERRRPSTAAPNADTAGDLAECSCDTCRTWSATLIADCVALCCCPCALVGLLVTTFLRLPWALGRRWLRSLRNKRELKRVRGMRDKGKGGLEEAPSVVEREVEGGVGIVGVEGEGTGNSGSSICTTGEMENVWEELHQMGHLGFGRVSTSTPPSQGHLVRAPTRQGERVP